MTIFRDFISSWRSEDMLSQAWKYSYEMMNLSKEMFVQAVKLIRERNNIQTVKALKKRDKEINEYQQNVRRKIMTHYSVSGRNYTDISGMVLLNMVVDIERLGDYTKNILDLSIDYKDTIIAEDLLEELYVLEQEIISRFEKTIEAVHAQDSEVARSLMETYKEQVISTPTTILRCVLSGELSFGSEAKTAAVVLYARFLKRIGAHLKNITSTLVNPVDAIGYKHPDNV